jgi:hypothetical protein
MRERTKTPATVGRVVYLRGKKWGDRLVPAIVNFADPDGTYGVTPQWPFGLPECAPEEVSRLMLYDPAEGDSPKPDDRYWLEWMPFQKGQQGRTDQAEGALLEQVQKLKEVVIALGSNADHSSRTIAAEIADVRSKLAAMQNALDEMGKELLDLHNARLEETCGSFKLIQPQNNEGCGHITEPTGDDPNAFNTGNSKTADTVADLNAEAAEAQQGIG